MCLKYKKRNFMLPVKSVIPPNNSLLFPAIWNICRIYSAMESKEKVSDLARSVVFLWMRVINGDG